MSLKPQIPIVNLGALYAFGCVHAPVTGDPTIITISPGQLRDATNTFDIVVDETLTVSTLFNGAGGLDQGTVAINTFYAVYVLYDSSNTNKPVGMLSASSTEPLMPSVNGITYSHSRIIGYIKTRPSNTTIIGFGIIGSGNDRKHMWVDDQLALTSGTATVLTPVSLSEGVPSIMGLAPNGPQAISVGLSVLFSPVAAADQAQIWAFISALNSQSVIYGQVAGVTIGEESDSVAHFTTSLDYRIQYQVTAGTVDIDIDSFTYTI